MLLNQFWKRHLFIDKAACGAAREVALQQGYRAGVVEMALEFLTERDRGLHVATSRELANNVADVSDAASGARSQCIDEEGASSPGGNKAGDGTGDAGMNRRGIGQVERLGLRHHIVEKKCGNPEEHTQVVADGQ